MMLTVYQCGTRMPEPRMRSTLFCRVNLNLVMPHVRRDTVTEKTCLPFCRSYIIFISWGLCFVECIMKLLERGLCEMQWICQASQFRKVQLFHRHGILPLAKWTPSCCEFHLSSINGVFLWIRQYNNNCVKRMVCVIKVARSEALM